jgi:hypothetical protein
MVRGHDREDFGFFRCTRRADAVLPCLVGHDLYEWDVRGATYQALIHSSAWKTHSPKFVVAISEPPRSRLTATLYAPNRLKE